MSLVRDLREGQLGERALLASMLMAGTASVGTPQFTYRVPYGPKAVLFFGAEVARSELFHRNTLLYSLSLLLAKDDFLLPLLK